MPKTTKAPTLRQRIAAAWTSFRKGFNAPFSDERHWRKIGSSSYQLPGTELDWNEKAGDGWMNSTTAICLGWYQSALLSAPCKVFYGKENPEKDKKPVERSRSAFAKLLASPNPLYSATTLWGGVVLSYKTDGNAYLLKWRLLGPGTKSPVSELHYMPHFLVEACYDKDARKRYYLYRPDPAKAPIRLESEDVIHFRWGIDPRNVLVGLSPYKAAIRSVVTDNEADTYIASLLVNMGVFAAMISPVDDEAFIPTEIADQMKADYASFTGDNRGRVLIAQRALKIEHVSHSPEELMLDRMRDDPKGVICASLGIDPMAVGLPSKNKTYSNYGEATKAAWETGALPTMRILADDLNHDAEDLGATYGEYAMFDTRDVAALRDDELQQAQILKTRAEAAAKLVGVGFDPEGTLTACELPKIPFKGLPEKTDDTTAEGEDDTDEGEDDKDEDPDAPTD